METSKVSYFIPKRTLKLKQIKESLEKKGHTIEFSNNLPTIKTIK